MWRSWSKIGHRIKTGQERICSPDEVLADSKWECWNALLLDWLGISAEYPGTVWSISRGRPRGKVEESCILHVLMNLFPVCVKMSWSFAFFSLPVSGLWGQHQHSVCSHHHLLQHHGDRGWQLHIFHDRKQPHLRTAPGSTAIHRKNCLHPLHKFLNYLKIVLWL